MANTSEAIQTPGGGPTMALDARYYTDEAVFAEEREKIFYASWQFACHQSELAKPGDYMTFRLLEENILLVRDKSQNIRAFYNVCQHRGHELLEGRGNTRRIVCPYHAWTYELDGHLVGAPNSENVDGFDPGSICLPEIRVELFLGFVFVNLSDEAPTMAEQFPGVEEEIRAFLPGVDAMRPLSAFEQDEPCNWKVAVENYNECYHCRLVHPTFTRGVVDPNTYSVKPEGKVLRHRAKMMADESMTYQVDREAAESAEEYSSWYLWPSVSFQIYPGGRLNSYHWRPLAVDRSRIFRGWYAAEGEDEAAILALAEQDKETTFQEDLSLIQSVQRGLRSRGYKPGPLMVDRNDSVYSEASIKALKQWVQEALG